MNMPPLSNLKVWVLSDGKAGHDAQSLGIAEALGAKVEIIPLKMSKWGKFWEYFCLKKAYLSLPCTDFPDISIATGYHLSLVNRWIKAQNPNTFTVQILPRGSSKHYDATISLAHDSPKPFKNNIIVPLAPNRITPQKLESEGKKWAKKLPKKTYPSPHLAVLVGGSNKHINFNEEEAEIFAEKTLKIAKKHHFKSIFITPSRRTGKTQENTLKSAFKSSNLPYFFWDGKAPNPYPGILHLADAVIATADSVSMVSEAATSGKPILLYGRSEGWKIGKFSTLYDFLEKKGYLMDLQKALISKKLPEKALPLTVNKKISGFILSIYTKKTLS